MFKKIYFYSRLCLSDMIISVDTGTCAIYIVIYVWHTCDLTYVQRDLHNHAILKYVNKHLWNVLLWQCYFRISHSFFYLKTEKYKVIHVIITLLHLYHFAYLKQRERTLRALHW